jgi:asparagine synthase (glutamine-hydrolysing)
VLFAGSLVNARELDASARASDAANVVRGAFRRQGIDAIGRLRGPFAVLILERGPRRLWAARDQVGHQPFFTARAGTQWLFSGSPVALHRIAGVTTGPDAVALSEYLCGWYPAANATGYRGIDRVAPATVLKIENGQAHSTRYWDPWPEDTPIQWLNARALDRFGEVFARAVARSIEAGPSGIFLSGGLDSIAVATTAADALRARGEPPPYALSLVFPDRASNEEAVQAGVARALGLSQTMLPLARSVEPEGLVARALRMSAEWPVPMWNVWAPAYERLAGLAGSRGCRSILTGRGGDEWLTITPYLAADLIKRGDLGGVGRLLRARRRSQNLGGVRDHARLLWLTAGRPLASAALDAIAPRAWHGKRRQRLLNERPSWVAPDGTVRGAMDERIDGWIAPARPQQGFYVREMRLALTHPAVVHDLEETQELGRRVGLRVFHPFWDVDLIELMYRTPPQLLINDGRSKWLLRRQLAGRFPGLGLESRGKVSAADVFRELMRREGVAAWRRLDGARALSEIGVVDRSGVESWVQATLASPTHYNGRIWSLLTLETWVRQRFGVGSKGETQWTN